MFQVHYDRYDNKFKDSHDSLTWTSEEEEIQKFKHEHIYPVIVKGEVENSSMAMWLEKLSNHSYEPSEDVPEKIDEKELAGGDDDDDFDEEADDEGDDEKKETKNNSTVVTTAEESNLENGKTDKGTL